MMHQLVHARQPLRHQETKAQQLHVVAPGTWDLLGFRSPAVVPSHLNANVLHSIHSIHSTFFQSLWSVKACAY